MKWGTYAELLKNAQARNIILLGLFAKIPIVAIPATLTLLVVVGLNAGFTWAGIINAAWMAGAAVGSPWQGRYMGRHGVRKLLRFILIIQLMFWSSAAFLPLPLLAIAAFFGGVFCFAAFTIGRMAIAELSVTENRHSAFALDAITTELAYMSGPPLAVVVSASLSPQAAVVISGAIIMALIIYYFIANPRVVSKATNNTPDQRIAWGAFFKSRLSTSLLLTIMATFVIASYEVLGLAALKHFGHITWAAWFYIACGVASLIGGVVYGGFNKPPATVLICGLLAISTGMIGFSQNALAVCLLIIPAALLCSPVFSATANDISRYAAPEMSGLAMGTYGSALTAGNAIGFPLAGLMVDNFGFNIAFFSVGGLAFAVVVIAFGINTLFISERSEVAAE
ncbi:MFS transporter [Erwinia pyrifoliae]|uniref:MFS transporter n=2 Tax=Erwinia pyrifoliae TaxID=79967 RepID=A0ABY5X9H5_ERWPY|nr:MFS transporter [Erwinia pyrifoliae]AUX73996.1 MFS transporter [Erwinia pyrifoliae]MCA8875665.1 MFS transporter [Erwinia pyrifoliae]MCT2385870.1 MFS transporter [Erwinia pyrifoliae]MCU8588553.1 MFS transporter [Erwinia pyrifoliae]UWS29708.1 MFS transporter [Erwinia pyrifoliae]